MRSSRITTALGSITVASLLAIAGPAAADTMPPSDDAHVNLAFSTTNFGGAMSLKVLNSGVGGVHRSYVRFDLSALPPGVAVARATLRLWASTVFDPGTVDVHLVTSVWDEAAIDADAQPTTAAAPLASFNVLAATERRFVAVDVTEAVQDWLSGAVPNHGLALLPSGADTVRVEFDSKENLGTSHAPEIEVVLEGLAGPAGEQGPEGAQGPQGEQGPPGPAGPIGPAGTSVIGMSIAPGDPVCPAGGSKFVAESGETHACNGVDGAPGATGPAGESVVASSIGPGADCPDGGTKLTVGAVTTFACNGSVGVQGPEGPQGIAGPQGPQGPQGEQGPAGPSDNLGNHIATANLQMNQHAIDGVQSIDTISLDVWGPTTMNGATSMTGPTNVLGSLSSGKLDTGPINASGHVDVQSTLSVGGNLEAHSDINCTQTVNAFSVKAMNLAVAGPVKVAGANAACDASTAGSLSYAPGPPAAMRFCDGVAWRTLQTVP